MCSQWINVFISYCCLINRSVREGVEWIVSESMLVWYIHYFRDSYWPKGQLAPPFPVFTEEEKQQTKDKAREKFLRYFPGEYWPLFNS